jgi:methyl-accepting chemotaxis protein
MDGITQQNSALVEENAATAKTLEQQSLTMTERVGFFRVAGTGHPATTGRKPDTGRTASQSKITAPQSERHGRSRPPTLGANALKADPNDWKEF